MLRRADDQIFEISERVFANHVAFVGRDIPAHGGFSGVNVKMILPEIDHHFLQLVFGINGAQHAVRGDLRH